MILGKINFIFFLFLLNFLTAALTEEKITTIPLVNLENLEPSFEEEEENENVNILNNKKFNLKEKKLTETKTKEIQVNIVALDKITAKTSDLHILLGETKKFGLLEIKALQCGNVKSSAELSHAAYIQVKDLSENKTDQVFVFNGWTFSSSTTLRPLDHPVYDFWLVGCDNV
ncbi:MAG: hypothetical protein FD544_000341 [Pelagibacterales bacterium]|nr:hypothetical protein [Pelagibacterales bacterium]|tara:strand:+ start:927 stop:1442 length:516 start_codon:yes stop_codon:yes gene_type:complete